MIDIVLANISELFRDERSSAMLFPSIVISIAHGLI